jgi:hypothetical protein
LVPEFQQLPAQRLVRVTSGLLRIANIITSFSSLVDDSVVVVMAARVPRPTASAFIACLLLIVCQLATATTNQCGNVNWNAVNTLSPRSEQDIINAVQNAAMNQQKIKVCACAI